MPKSRLTYDGRLIYQTSYEARKAYAGFSCKIARSSEMVFVYLLTIGPIPKKNLNALYVTIVSRPYDKCDKS